MADSKQLTSNVFVANEEGQGAGGTWYGPDYPDHEVTEQVAAKITNPAAWAAPAADPFDFSDRTPQSVLDGLGMGRQSDGSVPLEQRSKADLVDLAEQHGVDSSGTKAEVLAALQAAGVEG